MLSGAFACIVALAAAASLQRSPRTFLRMRHMYGRAQAAVEGLRFCEGEWIVERGEAGLRKALREEGERRCPRLHMGAPRHTPGAAYRGALMPFGGLVASRRTVNRA